MLKNKKTLLVLAPLVLAGCADYMSHRDSITLRAGDAPEANAAIHAKYPWPPNVSNTTIYTHGSWLPAGQVKKKKESGG